MLPIIGQINDTAFNLKGANYTSVILKKYEDDILGNDDMDIIRNGYSKDDELEW